MKTSSGSQRVFCCVEEFCLIPVILVFTLGREGVKPIIYFFPSDQYWMYPKMLFELGSNDKAEA